MKIGNAIGVSILGILVVGGAVIGASYQRDMASARARVSARSRMIDTACGRMEYGEWGDGPPVLVSTGQAAATTRG